MKKIQSYEQFINEKFERNEIEDILLETEIEYEIENNIYEFEDIKDFDDLLEEIDYLNNLYQGDFYYLFEDDLKDDIDSAKKGGARSTTSKVINAIGWFSFPYISILRSIYKIIAKKVAIRRLVKKETDPVKKIQLRNQLKDLTRKQVSAYEELQKAKEKAAKKKEEVKDGGKVKDIPEEKRKALVDKAEKEKKEAEVLRDKIEKQKEKGSTRK